MKREDFLRNGELSKVFLKLSIPAIVAMLISAVYNVVDTIFVGMLNNTQAIAAVSISFPFVLILVAFGQMIGVGASSFISRLLGAKKYEKANLVASEAFLMALFLSILLTILGTTFLEPILYIFGASETVLPYAKDYAFVLVLASFTTVFNMTLNSLIRAEGNSKYSMRAIILGAVLNIVLDPIFIFTFKLGVQGAAIATAISQSISTIYLIRYYFFEKSIVKLDFKHFKFSSPIAVEIIKVGFPSFIRQTLSSVMMMLINFVAKSYGDFAVAALGIVLRVNSLTSFVIFGFSQGYQPIAAFSYGANLFRRLRKSTKICLKYTLSFAFINMFLMIAFSKVIIGFFSKDPNVVEVGSNVLLGISLAFPFMVIFVVFSGLFQSIGRSKEALGLVLSTILEKE